MEGSIFKIDLRTANMLAGALRVYQHQRDHELGCTALAQVDSEHFAEDGTPAMDDAEIEELIDAIYNGSVLNAE